MVVLNYKSIITAEVQITQLKELLNNCDEIDQNIEVNIVTLANLNEEINDDTRIKKTKIGQIKNGKAFLPNELIEDFRQEKICYCGKQGNFNNTIKCAFHECYHFDDPFDYNRCIGLEDEETGLYPFENALNCNIKAYLSEFYADFKAARYLLSHNLCRNELIDQLKIHFAMITINANNFEIWNQQLQQIQSEVKLIDKIFLKKISERFFRILGIWRAWVGTIPSFVNDEWAHYMEKKQRDEYIAPQFYEELKQLLLEGEIDLMEVRLSKLFVEYITNEHLLNLPINPRKL